MTQTFQEKRSLSPDQKGLLKNRSQKKIAKGSHVKADCFIKGLKEAEEEPSGGDENIEMMYSKAAREPRVRILKCITPHIILMVLILFKVMDAP